MIDETLWQLVAANQHGVLATVSRDGRPQLSNVLFVVDQGEQMIRISTTADRVKARNLARDPRAALHVQGENFWAYAVAEGPVTLSEVAAEAGDDAGRELMAVHFAFYGDEDPDDFYTTVIAQRRLVVRLHVEHVYGLVAAGGRIPRPGGSPTDPSPN